MRVAGWRSPDECVALVAGEATGKESPASGVGSLAGLSERVRSTTSMPRSCGRSPASVAEVVGPKVPLMVGTGARLLLGGWLAADE